jgi:hypothetical protein
MNNPTTKENKVKITEAMVNQTLVEQIKEVNPLVGKQLARYTQKYIDKARCVESLCREVAKHATRMSDDINSGYLSMTYNCFNDLAQQNEALKILGEAFGDIVATAQAVRPDLNFEWNDLFISMAEAFNK